MSRRLRLAGLALAAAAATLTAHGAQPPDDPKPPRPGPRDPYDVKPYTGFPEIKSPGPIRVTGVDAKPKEMLARLGTGFPRPLPADAPALVRVRTAQVNHGYAYVAKVLQAIEIGRWNPDEHCTLYRTIGDVYRVAQELEPTAAGRIALGEEQVRLLKLIEAFIKERVYAGSEPPQRFHQTTFYRLQAEAELLQLMEATKGGKEK